MSSPSTPQESLNRANVIKWTEALRETRNTAVARASRVPLAAPLSRRRQRRAPGPPPGCWPLPGSQPACPLPDPALGRLCAVPDPAPPYDDDIRTARPGHEAVAQAGDGDNPGSRARPGAAAPVGDRDNPGSRARRPDLGSRRGDKPAGRARPASGVATRENLAGGADREVGDRSPGGRLAGDRSPGGRLAGDRSPRDRSPGDRLAGDRAGSRRPDSNGAARPAPAWPSQFAQVLAETLAGSRPSRQLTPWTTERARGHIRRLGPLLAGSQEPRIRRIVASTPSAGVVEMAVVVRFGPRIRALAVRLERAESTPLAGWQCTAIEAA